MTVQRRVGKLAREALATLGFELRRTGEGFLDADRTVRAARRAGVSVCEYLESQESDPRKHGRRDRVLAAMEDAGALPQGGRGTVVEIGAGTGRYVEGVLARSTPSRYEVYETDRGWSAYLSRAYGRTKGCSFVCQPADGSSLRATASASADLVHAHGVFVYLPLLKIVGYLEEAARVCRPDGHIVFDCFVDTSFTLDVAHAWARGPHRFPVVVSRLLLDELARSLGMRDVTSFQLPYGDGFVDYVVWQKRSA